MSERPRVLVVVGTRPEGIKLAPVIAALGDEAEVVETRVALTGQHSELLNQALAAFDVGVDWNLAVMREGQDVYDVVQSCLDGLRQVVREYDPELVLVQGDTASAFAGALVAFFERKRVAHVEAGLRSGDKWRPYPEEVLRRLAGVLADVHFAPTEEAWRNLLAEGVDAGSVYVTGNTVVDAVKVLAGVDVEVGSTALRDALASGRRLMLVTMHRREAFGEPLREVFGALREVADRFPDVVVLFPVHPNPNVKTAARQRLGGHDRIVLTDPLGYWDLLRALRASAVVLTDSGGIQEEAPSFGTPVLVLRELTERPEGVRAGLAQLVGTDRDRIVAAATALLADEAARQAVDAAGNPYGDGVASARIADIVVHMLTGRARRTTKWDAVP